MSSSGEPFILLLLNPTLFAGATVIPPAPSLPSPPLPQGGDANNENKSFQTLAVGDVVLLRRSPSRYTRCSVLKVYTKTMHAVIFPSTSLCQEVAEKDIVSPLSNLKMDGSVEIMWKNGLIYNCIYKGKVIISHVKVKFEDGAEKIVNRDELFTLNLTRPKMENLEKPSTLSNKTGSVLPNDVNRANYCILQECRICGECFEHHSNFRRHLSTHSKPYRCDLCSYTASQKIHVEHHKMTRHGFQKPFSCELCPKTFCTKQLLKSHHLFHKQEKPFLCVVCARGFRDSSNLLRHERIHRGEKRYSCKNCSVQFNYKDHLKAHQQEEHPQIRSD